MRDAIQDKINAFFKKNKITKDKKTSESTKKSTEKKTKKNTKKINEAITNM